MLIFCVLDFIVKVRIFVNEVGDFIECRVSDLVDEVFFIIYFVCEVWFGF